MRLIILVLALSSCVLSQSPAPARVADARDERVQVFLKNGHSLVGIVRGGARIERLVRGRFVPSDDKTVRLAGVRVWYYQDLDGYIFLEYKSLERIEVLGVLTSDESRALADAVAAARWSRSTSNVASSRPSTPDRGDDGDKPADDVAGAFSAEEKALLDAYPPEKGWNPDRFGEIQRRKIVLHVNPTSEEQGFVDVFPSFQAAFRKWEAQQAAKADSPPKPVEKTTPPGDG
jgi:hypothetical protein